MRDEGVTGPRMHHKGRNSARQRKPINTVWCKKGRESNHELREENGRLWDDVIVECPPIRGPRHLGARGPGVAGGGRGQDGGSAGGGGGAGGPGAGVGSLWLLLMLLPGPFVATTRKEGPVAEKLRNLTPPCALIRDDLVLPGGCALIWIRS